MGNQIISLEGVRKSYGHFTLGPMDLQMETGYVVAVVGTNGSGKSTLFRMLMNLARPDGGELELFGMRYPQREVDIKQRLGYVPEHSVGHDDLTANALGSFVSHWYPSWNGQLYENLLQQSGVEVDKRFGNLSKGTQRRLSFALAMATGAEMLLLDEPTEGVDPFTRRKMMEAISLYMQDGHRTVLFSTHTMQEVRHIADYVAVLHEGAFLGLYEKDALLEQWKTFWVDCVPSNDTPGLVEIERGSPVRLITCSPEETQAALIRDGIRVVRSGTLDVEEILSHLIRERTKT